MDTIPNVHITNMKTFEGGGGDGGVGMLMWEC